MYDFHYEHGEKKHNAKLLFTDTDSLVYKIETYDVYEDFYKDKHLFHLSNCPKDSKLFDPDNEKVSGKMKDESKGKINDEFVGLKSRTNSIKYVDGKEHKRAKGINQNIVKNTQHVAYFHKDTRSQ